MTRPMRIDYVSDVMCPWCVIGLRGLDIALERIGDDIDATIHFQPFELNPDMPAEGQDTAEHIRQKYGSTPEQSAANRAMISERAQAVGFPMNGAPGARMWNSFDAHRLLDWAGEIGPEAQHRLKMALFTAHFTDHRNISDHAVLLDLVAEAGLDPVAAASVLADEKRAADLSAHENYWRREGIQSVPAIIIDGKYLISGGQPPEVFEQALRRIAAEAPA